jgi:hypothetical protein
MAIWYPIDGSSISATPAADLDVSESLSLGFTPFSLDQSGKHRSLVLDAMRYADRDNVRWGVGARLILHAWSETASIKGSVALVAAQASLNLAYTRTTFLVLGYDSPDLVKSLPGFEEMTVSNYTNLMKAIDACKDAVMRGPAECSPRRSCGPGHAGDPRRFARPGMRPGW